MKRRLVRNAAQVVAATVCACAAIVKEAHGNHGAAFAFTIAAMCFLSYALSVGER